MLCHVVRVTEAPSDMRLNAKLIDQLYVEAMVLADETRAYFDDSGRGDRESLAALQRVAFSCEALRVTTRLMHVLAWLLSQRAMLAGEITPAQARSPAARLGAAAVSDPQGTADLPSAALSLVRASEDLYDRIRRLDEELCRPDADGGARALMERLERSF